MVFNEELQIELPNEFPRDEFTKFMAISRSALCVPSKSPAWQEFAGASNLIGWRFRSSYEDMKIYIDSVAKEGIHARFEELYYRERALFGMFHSGVSCIDSTCYAINALASHSSILGLPFGYIEQRNCSLKQLSKTLANYPRSKVLASTLSFVCDAEEWTLWSNLRNRMTHRSNLPRIVSGTLGETLSPAFSFQYAETSSTPEFTGDTIYLENLFIWLADSLRKVLIETCRFVESPRT